MGLDMNLYGSKFLWDTKGERREDGFPIAELRLELGYWRKHPNLHGFIVNEFADGVDECQDIPLCVEELQKILDAVLADTLPHTTGFFFGKSTPDDRAPTIEILERAIAWVATQDGNASRSVIYQSSW